MRRLLQQALFQITKTVNSTKKILRVGVKTEFRKQGICHAMLAHAINNEISKGCNKFVLVATEIGQQVYSRFGFETIMSRYDYILKKS